MNDDLDSLEQLQRIVGKDYIKSDSETLSAYAVDGVIPWAILFPDSPEQISDLVRLAQKERWALLPRGSGSKIGIGNLPSRLDLVISTDRLSRIIDMDTANLTVTVQAGVRFKDIQTGLSMQENRCYLPLEGPVTVSGQEICSDRENRGCFLPMMPPYSDCATLGGIIAANSIGPTRLLYGLPRDMVLGVRYVAPNSEIIGMGGRTVKNVSGYDMSKLMIGSYGTLGILCEMTLRLLPLPERMETFFSSFSSLSKASGFIDHIFQTRMLPMAVELFNSTAYSLLSPEGFSDSGSDDYVVAVGLEGFEEAVERMGKETKSLASEAGSGNDFYIDEDAHREFWYKYTNLGNELSDQFPGMVSVKLNYPISRYREICELIKSLASEKDLEHGLLSHAGNGICWIHFLEGDRDSHTRGGMITVVEKLLENCQALGGNLMVERATSELKKKLPVWGAPREDYMIMKRIKEEIDPLNLFCPGRFVGGI